VAVVFPVGEPDLVVLDLGLLGLPGDEVARLLRKDNDVPIVMLTAKASENDRVTGLRLGADDYMVKPFSSPRELVARVEAVLRRSGAMRTDISTEVAYGGGRLRIDGERREVRVDGALVELTRSEFDLLAALASRPGRAWVRLELVSRMQGYAFEAYERTIDVHVKTCAASSATPPRSS
jgi:DNA-binding response OmpR family regulator